MKEKGRKITFQVNKKIKRLRRYRFWPYLGHQAVLTPGQLSCQWKNFKPSHLYSTLESTKHSERSANIWLPQQPWKVVLLVSILSMRKMRLKKRIPVTCPWFLNSCYRPEIIYLDFFFLRGTWDSEVLENAQRPQQWQESGFFLICLTQEATTRYANLENFLKHWCLGPIPTPTQI